MARINKIQSRRRARELALQMCYLFDVRRIEGAENAEELFKVFLRHNPESDENAIEYARELIGGIEENRAEIDGLVRMNMTGWRPERMGTIDRAAVFLALYEGVVGRKVDVPVAISEAVELARLFGSDESARFVNGVLGRIVRAVGAAQPLEDGGSGAEAGEINTTEEL
ncbi:MAG: transcription antitermination factor NusB [Synergistaceae bacterium]|nr:transcription antitermination factor NusB [Synergistaceae bacterium]